jgi:hypothetical protein
LNAKSEFGIGFAKAFITYTSVGRFVAQKRISVKKPGLHLSGCGTTKRSDFPKGRLLEGMEVFRALFRVRLRIFGQPGDNLTETSNRRTFLPGQEF